MAPRGWESCLGPGVRRDERGEGVDHCELCDLHIDMWWARCYVCLMGGPFPDVARLRRSRIAVLQRLVDFGRPLIIGATLAQYLRIARWLRVALFMIFHIGHGALDAPWTPRKPRGEAENETLFENLIE